MAFRTTEEVTFEDDDKLQLHNLADRLAAYLEVDRHFTTGSLVVSLEAPFGSGKSWFLSMWKKRLEEQFDQRNTLPVLLNAWEDDYCGDPLMSIIASLIESLKKHTESVNGEEISKLEKNVAELFYFGLHLGGQVIKNKLGMDFISAENHAKAKADGLDVDPPDFLKLFEARKKCLQDLKATLKEVFSDGMTAIILVDELDRCRPTYAIDYLETIKHIFDIPSTMFVLGIDREQIENSARSLFGQQLDANEYLRKFIARSYTLPVLDDTATELAVTNFSEKFLELEGIRTTNISKDVLASRVGEFCFGFNMTLRQIETFFRILGHVFTTQQPSRIPHSFELSCYLLTAIKIKSPDVYAKILKGTTDIVELLEFMKLYFSDPTVIYYGKLLYTGLVSTKTLHKKPVTEFLAICGLVKTNGVQPVLTDEEEYYESNWERFAPANRLKAVCERIEDASTL